MKCTFVNTCMSIFSPVKTGKALAVGIESLTLDGGGTIEDLDIDFTLPGYPDLELKVSLQYSCNSKQSSSDVHVHIIIVVVFT